MRQRFSLQDPALSAADALRHELARAGVKVEGGPVKGKTPATAAILATIEGPPLKELLREMNVNSLNVVADNLLLLLGAERYGAPGTREKGLRVVYEFLASLGLSADGADIADGAGLLEGNRATAGYMAAYLRAVTHRPWFPDFRDTLPRAGIDGTLKHIGYRDERFRVKSGRLENTCALAGYGVDGKGREIAFAYIVNTPGPLPPTVERSGAGVMRYLSGKQD